MILGIGTDVVNIKRVELLLTDFGERFEQRLFAEEELALASARGKDSSRMKAATLAKRIAAKEAFVKAIGKGFTDGIAWKEIVVKLAEGGKPTIEASGKALSALQEISPRGVLPKVQVSLADDYPIAQAFVVISLG